MMSTTHGDTLFIHTNDTDPMWRLVHRADRGAGRVDRADRAVARIST